MKILALTGNEAAAYAIKQIEPDVIAAYPITPQTGIIQKVAEYVADGIINTEMIHVESEHSAMSATVGASAAGARAMTATSANGLALMWEIVYIAASYRLPIVMPLVNRALSGPINIHCDHSDAMGARDSGWIQLYSENAQEAYDNLIQAIRIAEHLKILLPVMVCFDGFIISHSLERVELYEDKEIRDFIGPYKPQHSLLDVNNPLTFGPLDLFDYYFEHKRQQAEAMRDSSEIILKVGREFKNKFGREYALTEDYFLKDAEFALVLLGSTAGTAKVVVDKLRKEGKRAGLLKIRSFRPFPAEEIKEKLKRAKAVAVLDRSDSFNGLSGPLFCEAKAALFGEDVKLIDYIYGLGGREIGLNDIENIYKNLERLKSSPQKAVYLGVRE
jgi:pyruvate ferredoxin oxidoreductase alpha subunit